MRMYDDNDLIERPIENDGKFPVKIYGLYVSIGSVNSEGIRKSTDKVVEYTLEASNSNVKYISKSKDEPELEINYIIQNPLKNFGDIRKYINNAFVRNDHGVHLPLFLKSSDDCEEIRYFIQTYVSTFGRQKFIKTESEIYA